MRILTLSLAAALAATTLLAQGPRGRRGGGPPSFDAVKEALTLNEAQVEAIQQNNQAAREQARTISQQAREKHQALKAELDSASPNPTTVGQLMIDARALQAQAKTANDEARELNLAILDETQKAALTALVEAEERTPALREAAMLNLIEGRGGRGPGGPPMGPRRGGFHGGPRG